MTIMPVVLSQWDVARSGPFVRAFLFNQGMEGETSLEIPLDSQKGVSQSFHYSVPKMICPKVISEQAYSKV